MKSSTDFVDEARPNISEVDLDAAAELLGSGAVALDVREGGEFEAGHLNAAINLPRGLLEFKVDKLAELSDRSKPILVYCQSGGRGALATYTLRQMGFKNVSNMVGGYGAWIEANKPIEHHPATWTE